MARYLTGTRNSPVSSLGSSAARSVIFSWPPHSVKFMRCRICPSREHIFAMRPNNAFLWTCRKDVSEARPFLRRRPPRGGGAGRAGKTWDGGGSCRQCLEQGRVFVKDFPPAFFAFEDAQFLEFLKVFGRGLAFRDAGIHDELDFAIRLGEDQFDQFLGIHLGRQLGAALRQRLVK